MKRIVMFILLVKCLTACISMEDTVSRSEVSAQSEISARDSEESIYSTKQLGTVPALTEVGAGELPFTDMNYISLIEKGGPQDPDDGATMFHVYTLLGGEWDTYEKGREFYETINSLYEGTSTSLKIEDQKRRHISCFSNDGERVFPNPEPNFPP